MNAELVDIQDVIPHVQVDLKYATSQNFTGKVVYNFNRCYLIKEAALKLKAVQMDLNAMGLAIHIWDGYRPTAVQWKFWELVPDERYVADPRKGGRHTRGTAVDLTLVTKDGQLLEMPTDFDDFSEKASRNYKGATEQAQKNSQLLQDIMEKHGFIGLPSEWWHYDLVGWENYPVVEVNI